ncbi:MAG: DUF4476 domain-containing protein, partial [Bacteroidia bacterium]
LTTMRKIFTTLLLFLGITSLSFAQNCQTPISSAAFQTGFNSIAVTQGDQAKLIRASRFVSDKCLSSAQVKTIALLFGGDSTRLEFCKTAYPRTSDQANYYDVYDAFRAFSYALRLYNYVEHYTVPVSTPTTVQINFPNYAYPDTVGYRGNKGCAGPAMTEAAFLTATQNVFAQPTDESKYVSVQDVASRNCLTFAQAMKLASLVRSDDYKMRVLTATFPIVYDQDHYPSVIVLFSTTQMQNNWTNYARVYLTPPPAPCLVTEAEFKVILNDVKDKRFATEKMNLIEMLSKDRCFSVAQIRSLALEFPFGDERMKTYKMLYNKCNNQKDYYQVVDDLQFDAEKAEMRRFINAGGK